MYLLSAVWIPVVSAYFFRRVFKLCDSKDEAVSLRHVCFNAFMGGVYRKIVTDPRYRVRLARSFVFIIPILLLAFRPADPGGSSMVRSYESSGFSMGFGNGGTDAYPEDDTGQSYGEENPWYDLRGLDEAEKTITIADEDYYTWMYELSNFYEKYEGYTVVMKGFVFRTPDIQKKCDFALVRLSMWCCAADLTPIGFLVDSDSEVTFKDDDWVTVTGTFGISEHEESLILKAQSIEAAGKPEEEYVYPYF